MTVFNGSANFFGSGLIPPPPIQALVTSVPIFAGAGLLDDFRVSNLNEYDPKSTRFHAGIMQLRKARTSKEGFFGDD